MNEDEILNKLKRKTNPHSLTKRYGVFGLSLGKDLYDRLNQYAINKNVTKAGLIKAILTDYLDKSEGDNNV